MSNPLATQESATYKLGAPAATIGTLTQDGVSGVVGRIGAATPSFPLQVAVRDLDTRRLTGAARAGRRRARDRAADRARPRCRPSRPAAIVQALYGALDGSPVEQSGEMCLRIAVRQRPKKPLGFCNTYVGGGGNVDALAGGPLVADAAAATQLLDAYDAGPLAVTGVAGRPARRARAAPRRRWCACRGPRACAPAARSASARRCAAPAARSVVRTIRVPIPREHAARARATSFLRGTEPDATQGDSGGDSATIDLSSLFEPSSGDTPPGPATIAGLARAISGLHRYDGVTARILPLGGAGAAGPARRRRAASPSARAASSATRCCASRAGRACRSVVPGVSSRRFSICSGGCSAAAVSPAGASAGSVGRRLDAERAGELAGLVHLGDDVAAADELAVERRAAGSSASSTAR